MGKRIIFTKHAEDRMPERGIDAESVKDIITFPDYLVSTLEGKKIASKKIGEKLWHVVYIEKETIIKVLTVYYE